MADRVRHQLYVDRQLPAEVAELAAQLCVLCGPEPGAYDRRRRDRRKWCPVGPVADGPRPACRPVLSRSGIGYDNVDVEAATARGIVVCVAADAPTVSTAEHAVVLHAWLPRSACSPKPTPPPSGHRRVRRRQRWRRTGRAHARTGRLRANRPVSPPCRRVAGDDRRRSRPLRDRRGGRTGLIRRVARPLDVVLVHAPLTDETPILSHAAAFHSMRQGVVFVNTARGGLVDHDALLAAVDGRKVSAAGVDVTKPEPLPPDHPLLHREPGRRHATHRLGHRRRQAAALSPCDQQRVDCPRRRDPATRHQPRSPGAGPVKPKDLALA